MVSNARLERIILEKIVSAAKKEFVKKSRLIKLKIAPVVYSAVYDSPEMSSVRNGVLKFDFGLTSDPTVQIAKAVAASCEVKVGDVRLAGNQILGGITIGIQPQDYLNVLSNVIIHSYWVRGKLLVCKLGKSFAQLSPR